MKPYSLLVFDWDGTLCDSAAHIVKSMQKVIETMGLPSRPDNDISQLIGLDPLRIVSLLFPEHDRGAHAAILQKFHYLYFSKATPSCLYDGAKVMLTMFKKAGYQLAIATGKSRKGLDIALRETELEDLIDCSRCADETCSKPDPQMLQEIMDELAVTADQTVMIGDTIYDLQLAENAKVRSIAISHGVHNESELLVHKPEVCFADLSSLQSWILES